MRRKDKISSAGNTLFDVVVIGGGITGAGIFLRCCQRGLKTLLVDQGDFAGGTSSRSAKMIHGGLRYLQYMQVGLVKEALEERENLLQRYPHLVRPLPFLFPVYDSSFGMLKMKVGLTGYDALSGKSMLPGHQTLSKAEVASQYPMLKTDGLKGAVYYHDALTNDARLTNEVIMEACELGGVAINYLSVEILESEDDAIQVLRCVGQLNGSVTQVRTRRVIAATGIWTDDLLQRAGAAEPQVMKASKGVHLVVSGEGFPERDVLLIPCPDKRMLWLCPWWDGLLLIGTTDTEYEGDLREPGVTEEDINYLLDNTNRYLNGRQIRREDVLSAYSGLRPLLHENGASDTVKLSRDYKVWWQSDQLLVIAGGKLTSFLSMADKVMDKLSERIQFKAAEPDDHHVRPDRLKSYLEEQGGDPFETKVRFFCRYQHVEQLSDLLTRRLTTTYGMGTYDEALVSRTAEIVQRELGWEDATTSKRIAEYRQHWEGMQLPSKK